MKSPSRIGLVHLALAGFAFALLFRSASVQVVQQRRWAESAQHQQSIEATLPAPRGDILDAQGELMAQSREMVKLEVSPQDVRDRRALRTTDGAGRTWGTTTNADTLAALLAEEGVGRAATLDAEGTVGL